MKNVLNYYYNLNPTSIHQINKNYKCYIDNDEYLLTIYEEDINCIQEIHALSYYLFQSGIPCHQIIANTNNELITIINNSKYVLLRIFTDNRPISINDLVCFSSVHIDNTKFKSLSKNNWYNMWINKIDYFEYQLSQFGKKYHVLMESANYYVGLAENSISFLSNNILKYEDSLVVSHKRINNIGLIDLLNPLNLIIDNRSRDLAEYIKSKFFNSNYNSSEAITDIARFNFTNEQYIFLFSRLLFPTYYFDKFEDILFDNKNQNELLKIINKSESYTMFLSDIYNHFIKRLNIYPIEWIIKK